MREEDLRGLCGKTKDECEREWNGDPAATVTIPNKGQSTLDGRRAEDTVVECSKCPVMKELREDAEQEKLDDLAAEEMEWEPDDQELDDVEDEDGEDW
jgi:hypothetical protein